MRAVGHFWGTKKSQVEQHCHLVAASLKFTQTPLFLEPSTHTQRT